METAGQSRILAKINAGEPRPAGSRQHATQREEVIVLAFMPQAIASKAAPQMGDESCVTLNGALRQLFVLKPDRDRRERRVIPRLAIGETFIVVADQRGSLFGDLIHAARRRVVELTARAQQRGGGDVVAGPNRLEIGGEEEPARPQHVIAVRVTPIRARVRVQDVARARGRGAVTLFMLSQRRDGREVGSALGQPEVLEPGPTPVVALAGPRFAAAGAAMLGRTPGIERQRDTVVGTEAAVLGQE